MKKRSCSWRPAFGASFVLGLTLVVQSAPAAYAVAPSSEAVADFNSYIAKVEARLVVEHRSPATFLVPEDAHRLRRGDPVIEDLTPAGGQVLPGALLHDWRGTALVRGATAANFERFMENFGEYPRHFAPQVVSARMISRRGRCFHVRMRIRQQHVIAVVMDTDYDVTFNPLDSEHGYSISHSTKIDEIASPGTLGEHALSTADAHGFLWRLNTYWIYAQQDGGLLIQIESISLTRSIPPGLGWAIEPFIESIPRDSLEFTLQSMCNALRQ